MASVWARTAVLGGLIAMMVGCASQNHALEARLRGIEDALTEARRSDRAISARIEEVENRLLLLRDDMETRQTLLYRDHRGLQESRLPPVAAHAPDLPTVRLQPESAREPPPPVRDTFGDPFAYDELDEFGRLVSPARPPDPPVPTAAPRTRETAREPVVRTVEETPHAPRAPRPLTEREQQRATSEYREALALTKEGRYDEAMKRFERFIERYPTHTLADNAAYWYAECYYAQGRFLEALQAFQRVIQDYPDGNKVPDAMLKTGLCYQNLGEMDQARRVLAQVIALYPQSPSARIATERARALP